MKYYDKEFKFQQPIEIEKEIWKDVVGYEEHYEISSLGRVRSKNRIEKIRNSIRYTDFDRVRKGNIMKPNIVNHYWRIILRKNNIPTGYKVARLVAIAFIPNPENKYCVNHIDGNKLNDKLENLEWATLSENSLHSFRVLKRKHAGSGKFGSDSWCAKKIVELDLQGNEIRRWDSVVEAAEVYSKNRNSCGIVMVLKGQRNKAHGRKWRYA